MSDSFADLWNTSAPIKPTQPQQARTLGTLHNPAAGQQRKPQNDVFSMLASSSNSSSRSNTPSYTQTAPKASSVGSLYGGIKPVQKSASSGGDAFGDLLGGTISSTTNTSQMTIAQRAALVEKQRQEQLKQQASMTSQTASSAWAGLDALGSTTFLSSSRTSPQPPAAQAEDDWSLTFDAPAKSTSSSNPPKAAKTTAADDDWGLDDFISKPAPQKPSVSQNASLWNLDEFSSPAPGDQRSSPAPANGRSSTPGSFDFGEREDGLLDDHSDAEDDILGALAKPARPKPQADSSASRATPSPRPPPSGQRSRAVSPPPHMVGQIVEMGFTPQQARIALAATDTGLDVQAALETLLANGAASGSSPPPEPRNREGPRDRARERQPERYDGDEGPPRQRIHPRRDRQREPPSRENSAPTDRNLQGQADELIAKASTIGLSMFNKANALWKEGREKVQKAYEERVAASGEGSDSGLKKDTRPKWMQDAEAAEGVHDDGWGDHRGGFRDDDDHDEVLPPKPTGLSQTPAVQARPLAPQPPREEPRKSRVGDLLSSDAPSVYVSPFRRKTPARTPASTTPEPAAARAQPKAPSPAPLIQRKAIPASPSEIATSAKHKAAGTEMFKLGRYAEAETSYSYAIAALPDKHLLLVPLLNNRALTRIKTGDHTGAIEDCSAVLKLIGPGYHPAREARVAQENEGAGVDLADAYVKALRRRAEAYEGKEKWDDARKDWEAISAADWAGKARMEAAASAGRCRRMVHANPDGQPPVQAPPKPKPKPQPRPARRAPTPPSEALNRVREANAVAEAEDNQRHALKDSVDGRLAAWKGGKEANIRALIASLDTILWPELGLQKVGMHELVTPSQVKIRYTKAIAKLHPDKLNVNNTTLEQRMIANGVFGALNDAWNAFKQ